MNFIDTVSNFKKKQEYNGKTAAFMTLGCKVNICETEAVELMFSQSGYKIVPFDEKADCYIINTCSVTAMSDKKSRNMIRRAKRKNPDATVAVMGCYAQKEYKTLITMPEVNVILGTTDRKLLIDAVLKAGAQDKILLTDDVMKNRTFEELPVSEKRDHTRAFIKIQDGCDRYCTYCIIPYLRGTVKSRSMNSVLSEVSELAKIGYKEAVLTGIHVASYGKDTKDGSLIELIEEINKIDGIFRIRTSSVEPLIISPEFMARLSKCEKFCPHFHLSLQSGSDKILKAMNRRYTAEEYGRAVNLIRTYYPYAALTTDIIVGFAGESEEDFKETCDFTDRMNFFETHVFPYSPREGTKAYQLKDDVSKEEKHDRAKKLIALSEKHKMAFLDKNMGKIREVLFEQKDGEYYKGHCKNYIEVYMKSEENLINKIKRVKLTGRVNDIVYAEEVII